MLPMTNIKSITFWQGTYKVIESVPANISKTSEFVWNNTGCKEENY